MSRHQGIFDADVQFSVYSEANGVLVLLFRYTDIFNHYGLEITVEKVALYKMLKGERVYIALHDAAWFRKGIWNQVSLLIRFNRFVVAITPEKKRVVAGEGAKAEGENGAI